MTDQGELEEQVALLLIFPLGVSEARARELVTERFGDVPEEEQPRVEAGEAFPENEDAPVIYFP